MNKHIVLLSFDVLNEQHIFKDLVLIPSMLNEIYGFRTTIAAYGINEELLHSEFENVNVHRFKEKENFIIEAIEYLIKNGKDMDILFLFGAYTFYDPLSQVYKIVNPKGKIYLKLDMNRIWLKKLRREEYFVTMLKRADLITVEDRRLQEIINNDFNCEVEYLRNGYYDFFQIMI